MKVHYPAHISWDVDRQLFQVHRSSANRLERGVKDVDFDHIQAPQGLAPATDDIIAQAGGERDWVWLRRLDSQRLQRTL